jgi:hypothetical protein
MAKYKIAWLHLTFSSTLRGAGRVRGTFVSFKKIKGAFFYGKI